MTNQNKQNFAINVAINLALAKNLLNKLGLCDNDCNCGCADNAVKACNSGCDCGCADPAVQANGCGKCEKGCADPASELKEQIELSGCGKCDKGCFDPATQYEACNSDCDCGCVDNSVKACNSDCDCGCSDPTCNCDERAMNQSQDDGGANQSTSGGDDDGSDDDHKCGCGCEHHKHHHNHHHNNGEHHHEHCNCGCEQEHNHESACQSEKNLADEYLNLARQVQADFDNYRRRNVEAIKQAKNDGLKQAVMEFLPSLDVVDRAMQYMHDEDSKQGLTLIRKMFEKAFSDLNIEPIRCVGAHYNPEFHDVVISEECDQPSGTIIEEIETGYTLDGKVIKHSVVKIAK